MLHLVFLVVAVALLALGALTLVRSPAWAPWQLAVLAGEFGHWLALLATCVAAGAFFSRHGAPRLATASAGAALLGAALLLKPAFEAWRIGRALPGQLARSFGASPAGESAFSWTTLFAGRAEPSVEPRTLHVAPELPLDFYAPVRGESARPAPCVVVVHGGGWDSGDRTQFAAFNRLLARQGYAVAAISYRLAPQHRWPAQQEDLLAALAFLKTQARALEIDATRLVLLGRSAGGQIALATAYRANDPAVCGVIGLYAPSDLVFGYVNTHENDALRSPALMRKFLGGTPETARENYDSASALRFVTRAAPPTLLLHGENDALVWHRHSVRLAARLAEQGVPHAFVSLPWATHAFDYNLNGPGGQLTRSAILQFLAAVTR